MVTAILAGLVLLLLGALAKGFFVHVLVILVAWLVKNGLLLGILKTRFGQRVVRHIRRKAYGHAGQGERRRRIYRVFRRVGRFEAGLTRVFSRLGALANSVFGGSKQPRSRPTSAKARVPKKG